jgi:hypothetical protein
MEPDKKKENLVYIVTLMLIFIGAAVFLFFTGSDLFKEKDYAEKVIESTEKGLTRVIGGELVEVDEAAGKLVIDTDPRGRSTKYTIYTNQDTEFSAIVYSSFEYKPVEIVDGVPVFEEDASEKLKPEIRSAAFSDFKAGMQIEVRFKDYVDIEKDRKLTAESIHAIIEE